jgi:hypothetical protein
LLRVRRLYRWLFPRLIARGCVVGMGLSAAMAGGQILGLGKPSVPAPMPVLEPPMPGYIVPAHETLTFTVDWRVFTGGIATFHLDAQGDVLKISVTGATVGAVNMLFPVADQYESSMDTKTGCSQGFSKQTQEGRRKISSDLTFDPVAGRQTEVERNLVKNTQKTMSSAIPACVTDSLSAMFYTGMQRLTVGQDVTFPLADALRTVPVTMKVEAREEIKTPAGTFMTVRVQPTADEGVVKGRGNIWIWYTDDARHMPVQMRARLFWGTITFHLQSVEAK